MPVPAPTLEFLFSWSEPLEELLGVPNTWCKESVRGVLKVIWQCAWSHRLASLPNFRGGTFRTKSLCLPSVV